jgi:hypothetical protein
MPQPDFFNINPNVEAEKPQESLEDKFAKERKEWGEKVASMNLQMKGMGPVSELMTEVYTERQICLEYYHYLISIIIKINRKYRFKYDERWNFWTFKSQIKYPNETSKSNKIQSELADIVEKREMLDNHAKFIDKTMGTIDNLIYAIPKRIEVEQISRGK